MIHLSFLDQIEYPERLEIGHYWESYELIVFLFHRMLRDNLLIRFNCSFY